MRLIIRVLGFFLLTLLLVPAGFSKNSPRRTKSLKKADHTTSATTSDSTPSSSTENADENSPSEPTPATALPGQNATGIKTSTEDEFKPAPRFIPLLATTGTIGLFTLETGDTIPKHGFAFSAFGNKFGRMPGSVSILEFGIDLSYGITDNLNAYAAFDPYGHVQVGCPGQLSLRSIPLNTCAPLAFGIPVPNTFFPTAFGSAPGYVQDYPFAANNTGGIGDITLGLKDARVS